MISDKKRLYCSLPKASHDRRAVENYRYLHDVDTEVLHDTKIHELSWCSGCSANWLVADAVLVRTRSRGLGGGRPAAQFSLGHERGPPDFFASFD